LRFTRRSRPDQEEDGRWIAEVPDLPGVMVYGDIREQCIAKVKALALRVLADPGKWRVGSAKRRSVLSCTVSKSDHRRQGSFAGLETREHVAFNSCLNDYGNISPPSHEIMHSGNFDSSETIACSETFVPTSDNSFKPRNLSR